MEKNDLIMGIVVAITLNFVITQFTQCERKTRDLRAKCIMELKDVAQLAKCKEIY